jgi:hypothetical protein
MQEGGHPLPRYFREKRAIFALRSADAQEARGTFTRCVQSVGTRSPYCGERTGTLRNISSRVSCMSLRATIARWFVARHPVVTSFGLLLRAAIEESLASPCLRRCRRWRRDTSGTQERRACGCGGAAAKHQSDPRHSRSCADQTIRQARLVLSRPFWFWLLRVERDSTAQRQGSTPARCSGSDDSGASCVPATDDRRVACKSKNCAHLGRTRQCCPDEFWSESDFLSGRTKRSHAHLVAISGRLRARGPTNVQ